MAAGEQQNEDERLRKAYSNRLKAMQVEQQKREAVRKYMTTDAYERLMNVRISSPELYSQLVDLIIQLVQSGRTTTRLTDEQLKSILAKLTFKPESRIEFKHK